MIITTLTNDEKFPKKLAKELNAKYSKTTIDMFPDGDLYLKFNTELKKEIVVIVETYQNHNKPKGSSNYSLYASYFAGKTAKKLGAKKVILVCPYLAFMRQDKMFNYGEAINAQIMAEMLSNSFDKIITIDPHLHRIKKMKDVFTNQAKNLTANNTIAQYIKKNFSSKNLLIMGPDWESYQWADEISKSIGVKDTVLEKDRHTTRHVDVKLKEKIDLKGKTIVIVDDIISTGNTMIKAAIKSKKLGAKKIIAIGVHGVFVENAVKKMEKHFDKIITVNTIIHKTNKIDIIPEIVKELK